MKDKNTRKQIEIEEFILVNNEKNPTYLEKNVKVKPIGIGTKGPIFEVTDAKGEKIGIVRDDKVFEFDKQYQKNLEKNMGLYYKALKLDSTVLKADVQKMIKEQEKRKINENLKYKKQYTTEDLEKTKNNKDKYENLEQRNQQNQQKHQSQQNYQNHHIENKKTNKPLTEGDINKYKNVTINDYEFISTLVDPYVYDVKKAKMVNMNGKFKLMIQKNNSDEYVEVENYVSKETNIGKIDTIEKNKEERDIGLGSTVTYISRQGGRVELNINQTDTGEIEIRKMNDIDNDGTKEGMKISTDYNKTTQRMSDYDNIENKDINEVKDENNIRTQEINKGPLTIEQIKKILDKKDISEKNRNAIIMQISQNYKEENPTETELENIIESVEKAEIEEREEEQDRAYTVGPDGITRFHGRPI